MESAVIGGQPFLRYADPPEFTGSRHHVHQVQPALLEGAVQEARDEARIFRRFHSPETFRTSRHFDFADNCLLTCKETGVRKPDPSFTRTGHGSTRAKSVGFFRASSA